MFDKEKGEKQKNDKQENKKADLDNIVVCSMPEKYRFSDRDANKTTGMIIMIGGAVVIIAAALAVFVYFFNNSQPKVDLTEPVKTEINKDQEEEEVKKEEPKVVVPSLPTEEEGTSTPEEIIATTTKTEKTPEDENNIKDTDKDGLFDKEEILLGSSISSEDTDKDSYDDLAELKNLYNPAGAGHIKNSRSIDEYKNTSFAYSVLYPKLWSRREVGGSDSIMFKTSDNQFIQIIVQPNAEKNSIEDWYATQFNRQADTENIVNGEGWTGIKNTDLILYLTDNSKDYIYTIAYNPGDGQAHYINIFELMKNSFVID